MGKPRKNFITLEPYFLNNQIFLFGGFGDLNSSNKLNNTLYEIYRFLCFFSITITFSIQLVDIYLLLGDLGKLAQDMCAIFVTAVVCLKMYVMTFRTELIEDLKSELMSFRMSRTHPDEELIYEKASRTIHAMTKTFYFMGTTCVIFWIFFPAMDSTSERVLPYPWLFPIDHYQSPYYEIIYIFQSLSLFSYLINIVSVDLGYSSYVVLLVAEFDCLCRDMRQISSAYDKVYMLWDSHKISRDSVKAMKETVNTHISIFRHMKKLENSHSDFLFLQMSFVAIMISTVILDTILVNYFITMPVTYSIVLYYDLPLTGANSRSFSLKLIQRVLYAFSACFDAWMLCFWGSQLQGKGEDFAQEVYNVSWMNMDVKCRKMLLMILMRAQRPPKLINGMLCLELPLFSKIMQLSYNSAALLKNLT